MDNIYESDSSYGENPLVKRLAWVKVVGPRAAHTKFVRTHRFKTLDGKIVMVPDHYRDGFMAQAGSDSGDPPARRVIVHRNFFVQEKDLGRRILAEVTVKSKTTAGIGENVVIDIEPHVYLEEERPKVDVELKFVDERRSADDIRIPNTEKFIHFAPIKTRASKTP